jgi:hypothetical protein
MIPGDVYYVLVSAVELSLHFLSMTVPFMVLGVIFAELIVALKFVDKIAFIVRPLTNFAHLSDECGTSFMAAFVSPTSANSMLAAFYKDKIIEKKELFIASMITSFPAIVMHWRPMLPVLIPLLGVTGIIYFSILMLVGLVKTSLIMLAGRFLLVKKKSNCGTNSPKEKRPPLKDAVKISVRASKGTIKRILVMTIPITFIVFILLTIGVFDVLASYLSSVSAYFPIPPEGLGIIAAQFGSFIAAITVAGNILSTGVLTGKGIILTLLVGDVLKSFLTMVRFLTPYYVGIFGPKNGLQIMVLSTTIRTGVMLVVIFVLALFW